MKNGIIFEATEGELVWAHRAKFKGESEVQYETSNAPKIMPYLILGKENNKYYALLLSNYFKNPELYFSLSNKKYNLLNKKEYVRLSEIFELKQLDIVDQFYKVKIDEEDLKNILNKIVSLIFNNKLSLPEEQINIFKQIYFYHNPVSLGSVIEVKEDEQIKQYLIIREKNSSEILCVNCLINHNDVVKLNFADSKTFMNNQLLYLKLKNSLSLEDITKVLNLRSECYSNQPNTFNYEIGSILRIDNHEHIIVAEDDNNYYAINYQDGNSFGDLETYNKEYLIGQYITKIENTELLNILVKISKQYNEKLVNDCPAVMKEINQKIKQLEKKNK